LAGGRVLSCRPTLAACALPRHTDDEGQRREEQQDLAVEETGANGCNHLGALGRAVS